jgi:hypothetical protein
MASKAILTPWIVIVPAALASIFTEFRGIKRMYRLDVIDTDRMPLAWLLETKRKIQFEDANECVFTFSPTLSV